MHAPRPLGHSVGFVLTRAAVFSAKSAQAPRPHMQAGPYQDNLEGSDRVGLRTCGRQPYDWSVASRSSPYFVTSTPISSAVAVLPGNGEQRQQQTGNGSRHVTFCLTATLPCARSRP